MNKTERAKLRKVLTTYFEEIHKIYAGGDFREESFYPALNPTFTFLFSVGSLKMWLTAY